jgi:hypothetical protein
MSGIPYDSGYGAPDDGGEGYGSPGDGGAGDGIGDLGYGSSITIEELVANGELGVAREAFFTVPTDRRPAIEVGAEGGYLIELYSPHAVFEAGVDYVVKFQEGEGGAQLPDTEPGAYSAVSGSPYTLRARRGGRSLRVTTPPLLPGTSAERFYDIILSGGVLGIVRIPSAISVLPQQHSLEVLSVRSLPDSVYNPWGASSIYGETSEPEV